MATTPLLWTGGWDSTFRLLTLLLREQHEVQPYYILDSLHYRPAVPAEREAMRLIRQALLKRWPEAAVRLADTVECQLADIEAKERAYESDGRLNRREREELHHDLDRLGERLRFERRDTQTRY